jgi:pro-sigmaK processing inhibitor BofA
MNVERIMIFMMVLCGVMLLAVIFTKPFKAVLRLILRCVAGIAVIFAADFFLSPWGIAVGINGFSAAICTFFGLPGAAMLFGWQYIFERIL